jgi:hypothetical protein
MEGSRLVAKARFEPIGDVISPITAFIQASNALDVAAQLAIECKDIEGLNTVASLYIELGSRLIGTVEEDDEEDEVDHDALARKVPLGFNPPVVIPVEQPDDEQEITADE